MSWRSLRAGVPAAWLCHEQCREQVPNNARSSKRYGHHRSTTEHRDDRAQKRLVECQAWTCSLGYPFGEGRGHCAVRRPPRFLSNRLHRLAFAKTAAHFTGSELVALWNKSNWCPSRFDDTWHQAPLEPHHQLCSLSVVGTASAQHKLVSKGLPCTDDDLNCFGSADTCLHNFVKNVNDMHARKAYCLPVLLNYRRLLLPKVSNMFTAFEWFQWINELTCTATVVGVHYRGETQKARAKTAQESTTSCRTSALTKTSSIRSKSTC